MFGISNRLASGKSRIGRVLVGFMVLGFLCLFVAGLAAAWAMRENQRHTDSVAHTYEVEVALDRVSVLVERGETTRRGFLLTGNQVYRDNYDRYTRDLPPAMARVTTLTSDNPRQRANVADLRTRLSDLLALRTRSFAMIDAGRRSAALIAFAEEASSQRLLGIRARMSAMLGEERRLLAIRDIDQRRSLQLFYTVLSIAGAILLVVAIVSLLTILRYTRDLASSRDQLNRLNGTLEEQVAERTADLSRANEEIQRFAYIVSHDLRSPLVNVMGFTAELDSATVPLGELIDRVEERAPDLLTNDMRLAAREDLPEAIKFIRTSTQKMDRLINAILKLSREGRRVIAPEPLDIAAIADTAIAAMRQVIDDRGATVTVERPMPTLNSDRFAVEQILSNLVENATKYLQPGRPGRITVSATRMRERVVIAVADNGRGIDPRDHQRIFDLFRRSGAQDQPGEGIGLAHVRALAYRLGGTIDVASRLGEGATFRLNLPATFQNSQDSNA
ncbi:His Kinase A (phospho-acceptor) domain-containing protein [Sphingomonas gellani]|uniref:histidine kinase n=1 Tax=Sphingomonas gellani TaxID=1166340 RepID=A0A1H8H9R8_9SPHN|nr:sensor histidine kinase [Sphingomonas gellani]SEN52547.1 His Kinase A (phospho-acceptor) domain-containing protein [Sphingomonas gellani]